MSASLILDRSSIIGVGMGQIAVQRPPGRLQAVLGSCIGLVFYHRRLQLAAMAHIVLPQSNSNGGPDGKFADTALPALLAALQREGANPSGLVAKFAGGASMFGNKGPLQIGDANAAAVMRLLGEQRIAVAGQDVGGTKGRRVTFDCQKGELLVEVLNQPPLVL